MHVSQKQHSKQVNNRPIYLKSQTTKTSLHVSQNQQSKKIKIDLSVSDLKQQKQVNSYACLSKSTIDLSISV